MRQTMRETQHVATDRPGSLHRLCRSRVALDRPDEEGHEVSRTVAHRLVEQRPGLLAYLGPSHCEGPIGTRASRPARLSRPETLDAFRARRAPWPRPLPTESIVSAPGRPASSRRGTVSAWASRSHTSPTAPAPVGAQRPEPEAPAGRPGAARNTDRGTRTGLDR